MNSEGSIKVNPIHPKDLTKDDWIADLRSLFTVIGENNPYLYLKKRERGYLWTNLLDEYEKRMNVAKRTTDYLEVIFDAVQALQTGHSVVMGPNLWDLLYAVEWYRNAEPYCQIFSESIDQFYDHWKPILKEYLETRLFFEFEVLIMYDRGEYRIVDGHNNWLEKYGEGTTITRVNGIPILDAVKGAYEKGLLDYDFKRKWWHLWRIAPRHFGANAKFTIRTSRGEEKQVTFDSGPDYSFPNLLKFPEERLYTKIWEDRKVGYVRIGEFSEETIVEDGEYLLKFYKSIEDYELMIIDVRGNGGGTYKVWMENVIAPLAKTTLESKMYLAYRQADYVNMFREGADIGPIITPRELENAPPEVVNGEYLIHEYPQVVEPSGMCDFKGKIVVLTDAFTYSATDAFALFCKETGFAELYGTPTGGDGISYSPIYYVLPNSKLAVRFTPAMGLDYTGAANEEVRVKPDVFYESEYGNWDELIQYVLENQT